MGHVKSGSSGSRQRDPAIGRVHRQMDITDILAGQRDLIENQRIAPVVQFGRMTRHSNFPDTPTAREAAATDDDRALTAP